METIDKTLSKTYGVRPGELNVISSGTINDQTDMLDKLCAMGKLLDERDVPQKNRYVILSEAGVIAMFGEKEGKELWLEITKDLDKENVRILDPTREDLPPWET